MKIQKIIIAIITLVFVFGTTFISGGEPSNYEGQAYLETVNPITKISYQLPNADVVQTIMFVLH